MAVEEKDESKGRGKRGPHNVPEEHDRSSDLWLPPNFTVDDLWLHRKKKSNLGWLKDNLKLQEGSFKHLKTEYRRRFKNFYEALKASLNGNENNVLSIEKIKADIALKVDGIRQSEYNESFIAPSEQRPNDPSGGIIHEVKSSEVANRSNLSTNGKFLSRRVPKQNELDGYLSEYADKYIEHLLAKRAELCRTPTTLKLGRGRMEVKTECSDQFIKYEKIEKPRLCRKLTNLRLDGDIDIMTENREKLVPNEVQSRPPLMKKSTNLHLEGDQFLIPEYRHQYVDYHNPERSGPILPTHNLKSARLFDDTKNDEFTSGRKSPLIPFLRDSYNYHDRDERRKLGRSCSSSRYQSNVSLNRPSSQPDLSKLAISDDRRKGPRTPQKNAYLDFDRNQNKSLDRKWNKKESGLYQMYLQPEYRSAYRDFPRERPRIRKPESNFATGGQGNYTTEKSKKYKEYIPQHRPQSCKRRTNKKFEDPFAKESAMFQSFDGAFECQPEYRKAYIDYLMREKPPPGYRRRILEIPDININDELVVESEIPNQNDNTEKTSPTSKEKRRKSPKQKPSSSSSSVPSSPKVNSPSGSKKQPDGSPNRKEPEEAKSKNRTFSQRQLVFPRSTTPSPVPQEKNLIPTPRVGGNWRRHQFRESIAQPPAGNIWNSMEADPAFFILNKGVPNRGAIKNDLYKEQRWMPAWYNGGL